MLTLYIVSEILTAISALGLIAIIPTSLAVDMYKNIVEKIISITLFIMLITGIFGICNTYNKYEVLRNNYIHKIEAIKDAENNLEKFLIKYPQFREGIDKDKEYSKQN